MYKRIALETKENNTNGHKFSIDTNGLIYNDTKGTIVKGRIKNGYHLICVDRIWKPVHRYVAKTFIPNPDNLPCVNHMDGFKSNNNVNNLEWCTHNHNMKHAWKTGLCKGMSGTEHGMCKLTVEEVHWICKRLQDGFGYDRQVMPKHITKSMVENIKRRTTWVHVSKDYKFKKCRKRTRAEHDKYNAETIPQGSTFK